MTVHAIEIQTAVAMHYGVTVPDLRGRSRVIRVARPRQVAMVLCRDLSPLSLPQIGRLFNRDHTTVLHAVDRITELAGTNPVIAQDIFAIRCTLSESPNVRAEMWAAKEVGKALVFFGRYVEAKAKIEARLALGFAEPPMTREERLRALMTKSAKRCPQHMRLVEGGV